MEIKSFIEIFKRKVDEFLESGIIAPSIDNDEYEAGDWTFLFNCICFFGHAGEHNSKRC